MAENYFIAVVKNNDRWAYWVGLGIPTEGKMYEDFQVHRLNSNDANELAKAEKLAKELLRGKALDQITIDQFMTKSQRRRIGLLVAVERGEMLLRSKENA